MPSVVETPAVQHVDFSDTEKLIAAIERDGAVIATNFTSPETVEKVNTETKPWLDQDKPWKGAIFPPETRRCTRLVGRSKTAREEWFTNPGLTPVLNHFLAKTTKCWYEDDQHTYTTYPILSISLTMDIRPGAKGQRLHRDDKNFHHEHSDRTETGYKKGDDVELGMLVPGVEVTAENGATVVIPGSHLWDDNRCPTREGMTYATMKPGEAMLFLGSVFHAGGTNTTPDRNRPMHSMFFIRGTLRTEENQFLIYDPEEVKNWSPEAQSLAGYDYSSPNLNFVDFMRPMDYLNRTGPNDFVLDLDPLEKQKHHQNATAAAVGA